MAKPLVIVESPAKAKTLGRFLGTKYRVEASYGHIRDLPESAAEVPKEIKEKEWGRLGVDVESDFKPYYVVPNDKKKQVAHLKTAVKDASELLLATDPDREGEAISWHLTQVLKPKIPVRRIVFHEITEDAVREALDNPGKDFDAKTGELKNQNARLLDERAAGTLADAIRANVPWTISSAEQKPGVERPAPPFTTSTLTQEASRKLGFSTERTMQSAQRLFQGVETGNGEMEGLITYHRTDSTTLSDKAIQESARVIREMFGAEYYDAPRRYQTRVKNAQEAHEAIRPTDFRLAPSQLERILDGDDLKVYELIWKRTMASQMVDARVLRTSVE